jgi:hypothetical protein
MRWNEIVGEDTPVSEAPKGNVYSEYQRLLTQSAADVRAAYASMSKDEAAGMSKDEAFDKHYPAIQAANAMENQAQSLKADHMQAMQAQLDQLDNAVQRGQPGAAAKYKAARAKLWKEESKFTSGGSARKISPDERNMDF